MSSESKSRYSFTEKAVRSPESQSRPPHPGRILIEDYINPLGLTQSAFAIRLGVSFPRLNEIVKGHRSVTPDTALRLARVLGTSAKFWLDLQQSWDLWQARNSSGAEEISRLEPMQRTKQGEA